MGMFTDYSNESLLAMLHTQSEACVRIVNMPTEERMAPGPKGEASPQEAGFLNAMFATLAMAELDLRKIAYR